MIKNSIKGCVLAKNVTETDYNLLTNRPQINGVTLTGNKTSTQLGLAPEGYGDNSVWSGELSFDNSTCNLNLKLKNKSGGVVNDLTKTLPFAKLIKKIELVDTAAKNNNPEIIIPSNVSKIWEVMTVNSNNQYVFKHQKGSWLIYEADYVNPTALKNPSVICPQWYKVVAGGYIMRITFYDNTTEDIDLSVLFEPYVKKTTKVGTHDLEDDITVEELNDDLKDYETTLTNKTINADNNTITDLEVDNFKTDAISTAITEPGVDTKLPTEKAVVDYIAVKEQLTTEFTFEENTTDTLHGKKEKIVLKNNNNVVIAEGEDNGKWVDTDGTQSMKNKTLSCQDNVFKFNNTGKAVVARSAFWDKGTIKLYYRDKNNVEQCVWQDYKINNLTLPIFAENSKQIITDTTLTTTDESGDIKIVVTHPVEILTYAEYQALATKDVNTLYIISDYPSEDITETREMVNNRWVITRTDSTTPLLTFIQNNVVHNKKVYYTKPELNTLLDYKEDILNGGASTIAHDNLTANKILVSNADGKVIASEFPTSTLDGIGGLFSPTINVLGTYGSFIDNIIVNGYILNNSRKRYSFDLSFNVKAVKGTNVSDSILRITMPDGMTLNYDTNQAHCGSAARFSASNYVCENILVRVTDTTHLTIIIKNSGLLSALGTVKATFSVF